MSAWLEYRFDYIGPGAGAAVYIYGYGNTEAVAYSAVVYALEGEAYYPLGQINMTQTEVTRDGGGSIARTVVVQNLAPFNPCEVDINIIAESY
jgi:hypothetical protein